MHNKKHKKHTKLQKPVGGKYHRNEWTVIGAPCSVLENFVFNISKKLTNKNISSGFLDMSHNSETLDGPLTLRLEDKIDHWVLKNKAPLNERDHRKFFSNLDLLFVNGNHYSGDQQIVFINEQKKESLRKKLDRLTKVKMFVLDKGMENPHDYLSEYQNEDTAIYKIEDLSSITEFITTSLSSNVPILNGLVLNGGKSQRMGTAKGEISYHDKSQKEIEADILAKHCYQTYYSLSTHVEGQSNYKTIVDSFIGLGPYGGILSAFRENPNSAWLTVACDLPYMDESIISQLVQARNPSKLATCFYNPETDFPEPLITIWEPRAYAVLLDFLSQGYSCPRKVLINSEIEMIQMKEPIKMKNANTPEERAEAEAYLKSLS